MLIETEQTTVQAIEIYRLPSKSINCDRLQKNETLIRQAIVLSFTLQFFSAYLNIFLFLTIARN